MVCLNIWLLHYTRWSAVEDNVAIMMFVLATIHHFRRCFDIFTFKCRTCHDVSGIVSIVFNWHQRNCRIILILTGSAFLSWSDHSFPVFLLFCHILNYNYFLFLSLPVISSVDVACHPSYIMTSQLGNYYVVPWLLFSLMLDLTVRIRTAGFYPHISICILFCSVFYFFSFMLFIESSKDSKPA